jgi:hypothetical protein
MIKQSWSTSNLKSNAVPAFNQPLWPMLHKKKSSSYPLFVFLFPRARFSLMCGQNQQLDHYMVFCSGTATLSLLLAHVCYALPMLMSTELLLYCLDLHQFLFFLLWY